MKKLVTLFFFFSLFSFSQDYNWNFNRLSVSEGLSNTMVYDIVQDSKGFIWLGTANGLNRYNAYEIQVYNHDPEDPNSLSSNGVTSVFEDSKGNLWVGTVNGLNKFNRESGTFERFEHEPGNPNTPPKSVWGIAEDLNGNIWLATNGDNMVCLKSEEMEFSYPMEPMQHNEALLIREFTITQENEIWIAYNGPGIGRYNINTDETQYYHANVRPEISPNISYVFSIYSDQAGNVWAGSFLGGLSKYDPLTDNFHFYDNPYFPDNLTKIGVQALGEDMYGNIIVGGNGGGVFIFDPKTEKFIAHNSFNPLNENSISDDFIIDIYIDNTGIIWFGSENGGAFYHNPIENKFKSYQKEGTSPEDLPGVIINGIYTADQEHIWVATENNGFAILNRKTGKYTQHRMPNVDRDKGNTFIKAITHDNDGGVWIGSEMGGLGHYDASGKLLAQFGATENGIVPNVIPSHDILSLMMDRDGVLWAGCYRSFFEFDGDKGVTYCANQEDEVCLGSVLCLLDYSDDWMVVGYASEGIRFFNKKTREFGSHFTYDEEDVEGLPNRWVHTTCLDSKNRLWVGTLKGLSLMQSDSTFKTYDKKDGLSDNEVLGILEDHEGNLWISTSYGLSCFNPENETFKNYYEQDGLRSNVFRPRAFFKSSTGELFFGGTKGFNSFYPYDLSDNPYEPNVVFTDFKIFNTTVLPGDDSPLKVLIEETKKIELDYTQDVFSFEFAALSYTVPEKNEYAYKLEGFHDEWNFIGTRRYISFTGIPPGEYKLTVKACNNDGLWNEKGTSIEIIIHPPFWETWWFRTLIVLLLAGLIYFIYKRRVRKIEKQNKILEAQVADRTKELVEQKEIVEEKNKDMMDSIRYSKRIQDSFLPDINDIKKHFDDGFVLFKPKDIVSGDFYWYETFHDKIYLAVADCTGHGVPGAMVSVLGNNGLHRSIKDNLHSEPGPILDDLTDYVVWSLEKKGDIVRDGMDIALCSIDAKTGVLKYAGANNPLWINRGGEIIEYKATKQPIGKYADRKVFQTTEIQLEKGDWIFMFSDGFPDQFGGPKGKKFKYATLKQALLDFEHKEQADFEEYLNQTFENWKGSLEQIDDVCILGIKF